MQVPPRSPWISDQNNAPGVSFSQRCPGFHPTYLKSLMPVGKKGAALISQPPLRGCPCPGGSSSGSDTEPRARLPEPAARQGQTSAAERPPLASDSFPRAPRLRPALPPAAAELRQRAALPRGPGCAGGRGHERAPPALPHSEKEPDRRSV